MKIKTKLNLGVGLLFVMIMILAITSSFYVFSIKKDTQNILQANYITLEYSRNMLNALDNMDEAQSVAFFEANLKKQLSNITEKGEDKPTLALEQNFMRLKSNPVDESLKSQIRRNIFEIMKLNMNAIKQKSDIANQTAETGNIWIAVTGTFCFLIAFNLLINLPNNIANPIRELSSSIRQIANRNYSERVNFGNQNEFGDLARSFNTMAEKLEEYHNSNLYKLSFEKKRLETLINNMNDPIIGLDNEGVILFVNDEALRIMGLKSDEAIGRQAAELAQRNDLLKSLIVNSLESDKPHPMKIFANGKESYFEKEVVTITIKPTGEEQTITIGEVIILRNITVFKELDFAKTHFIATVSHELKTPISSIKLGLQLLENKQTGAINPEQQQLIDGIKDDSQRLLKITGELLELSQLETGNIQLTMEKTPPSDIVRYAVEAVKVQAEQKRIRLVVDCSPDLPEVKADTEKTAWVMINFLTNAIRYSPEEDTVTVRAEKRDKNIWFSVADKGKGIDTRYQARVFDKYFQIPGSPKTGTGLGLAISKEFIEAQNGTIGVESALGMGSTFYFSLPA
ncbi:ATP-binding protein [Flavobacterium sp.]|uniref:HAMP domain-containing sensor histidine kinase n=1 Tax=Flavobacterium sp. TaxID=239 RepID=UPI0026088213|nr:ATP-binding protein [Flavobacterium sp.]